MMQKAAIYARVSTSKQAQGELSLPDQITQCRDYALRNDLDVVEVFEDPGFSARSDQRPAFQRMLKLAKAPHHPFDVVLVHSQSRFARNTVDLLIHTQEFETNCVKLISISQDIGEGDHSDALRTIMGAVDELQSKETGKHVSRSMIENARQGFWNGSKPPFGYETYIAETRGARVQPINYVPVCCRVSGTGGRMFSA